SEIGPSRDYGAASNIPGSFFSSAHRLAEPLTHCRERKSSIALSRHAPPLSSLLESEFSRSWGFVANQVLQVSGQQSDRQQQIRNFLDAEQPEISLGDK